MLFLCSVAQNLVTYVTMAVMGIGGAPFVLWRRDWTIWWMKRYVDVVLGSARLLCGLRSEVRGPVPRGSVVVAAKHQSLMDVLILYRALPEPHFVMKRELLWAPVFGLYALRSGCIWVTREKRGQGKTMMRRLARQYRGTGQIVIYPQGTRVPPGEKRPYKRGAIMAYESFGLPMVLAATNVGWFWPKHSMLRHPGTAVIEFLETLPPGMPRDLASARMEQVIEAESDRLSAEAARALGREST
ncbi:MAG: 1-acyl-sn-glycerol-3-phosphate acyltransferase [Paracoccaceae bacterium]|nr:1-acyl-sn-glycerol-3-phosphate acyltransferase [Paracoccaceae bacterium]